MEIKKFNQIISSLDNLIIDCSKNKISSSSEFNQMTVDQLRTAIEKANELKTKMDRVCISDIYHIIGMGDLSSAQTLTFIKKLKEFLSYRPFIQAVALYNLPDTIPIPQNCEYRSKVFGMNFKKKFNEENEVK